MAISVRRLATFSLGLVLAVSAAALLAGLLFSSLGRSGLAEDRSAFERQVAPLQDVSSEQASSSAAASSSSGALSAGAPPSRDAHRNGAETGHSEPLAEQNAVVWFRRAAAVLDAATPALAAAPAAAPAVDAAADAADSTPASARDASRERSALLAASDWSPEQLASARSLLEGSAEGLVLARQASAAPESSFGLDPQADWVELPADVQPFLRLREVLVLTGRTALAEGDLDRALEATDALYRLRTVFLEEPAVIFQMLGFATDWAHLDLVQRTLAAPGLDLAALDRLARQLEAGKDRRRFAEALAADAARTLRAASAADAGADGWRGLARQVLGPWDQRAVLHSYSQLAAASDEPVEDVMGYLARDRPWPPILGQNAAILIPNLAQVAHLRRASESSRQLARWTLAARRQALEAGQFPQRLTAIAPEAPTDPYSGEVPQYDTGRDGLRLVSSEAEARWRQRYPQRGAPLGPRFEWYLPPVS